MAGLYNMLENMGVQIRRGLNHKHKKVNTEGKQKAISQTAGDWPALGICFVARRLQHACTAARVAPRIRRNRVNRKMWVDFRRGTAILSCGNVKLSSTSGSGMRE